MAAVNRILLVEHSPELGALYRAVLGDEGFEVQVLHDLADVPAQARDQQPTLLVLDLLPYDEAWMSLLDELRVDEETRDLMILAMSTDRSTAEQAIASYNVAAALWKPFDLDVFLSHVRESLGAPMFDSDALPARNEADAEGILALAAQILAERSREILFSWAQRLAAEPPWSERRDVRLPQLLNNVPLLLRALDAELQYDDPEAFFEEQHEGLSHIREHAELRRSQGFDLQSLVREYGLLREEIWARLEPAFPAEIDTADFFRVVRALDRMLDTVLQITIPAYLEEAADR